MNLKNMTREQGIEHLMKNSGLSRGEANFSWALVNGRTQGDVRPAKRFGVRTLPSNMRKQSVEA
jgi:hypothetical protein